MRWLIALVITMFAFSAAQAEVYEWVDGQGGVHFTDNPNKVPARYRKKVKIRESVTGGETTAPPSPAMTPTPQPAPPEQKAELYGGHGENWWRTTFKALRKELKDVQEKLPGKRDALEKLHRQYVISLGRSPKPGETGESRFFKSPQEGTTVVTPQDTLTPNPLSMIGGKRIAYYEMMAEIEKDEARVKELEQQIASLETDADRAGVPFEWRK